MGSPSAEVRTLADKIYFSKDQEVVNMAAQALTALIPTFSSNDKTYVLSRMTSAMGSIEPKWRQQIAMGVIVAVRHFA